jgi:X-X-X-Leu-X-X-Gly heptad repeat protein
MLCLTGCTPPFAIAVTAPTIASTPLPAAPSSARPPLVPSGPSPVLVNTGTNWAPMLASMLTYGQWLLANPGLGVTATVAAPGCPLTNQLTTRTASFSSEAWRLAPAPLTISWLGVPSALVPAQTTVHLQVDASRGAETVVDGSGQLASGIAALPPTTFDVSLNLGGDGRWRLCTADALGPVSASGAPASNPSLL